VHCIEDKPNGIIINHSADWSGDVRIAWYDPAERRDPGPTPPSLRECWCDGYALTAGRFAPITKADVHVAGRFDLTTNVQPPVEVLTRAVALAVESFLRHKLERVMDVDLFIKRGKL
jgi:hypothetical protein